MNIFYVDFGNMENVAVDNIRELAMDAFSDPCYMVCCGLNGLFETTVCSII